MVLGFKGLSGGLTASGSEIMGSAWNSFVGGFRKSWATCMTVGRLPVLGTRGCLLGEEGDEEIGTGLGRRCIDESRCSTGETGGYP